MPLHASLSGSELHYPLGRSSEGSLLLEDNLTGAYNISQSTNNMLNISTANSAEVITFGNVVTNPDVAVLGDGTMTVEGKMGVGTSTPTETLHIRDGRTSGGSSGLLIQKFEAVSGTSYGAFVEATGGSTKNIGLYVQAEGGSTNYGLLVPSGKVGIGTTGPDKALEINSADGNNLRLTHNDSNGSAANYADLQVGSSGYAAIRSSASAGQGAIITKTVVQSVSTAGVKTYSAAELFSGYIIRDPAGDHRSDITPAAADIVAAIPNCAANDSFRFIIKNAADAADEIITMTGGTGVTIVGTATIGQNNTKEFLCVITDTDGSAIIYSLGTWTH